MAKNTFNSVRECYLFSENGLLTLKNRLQELHAQRLERIQNLKLLQDQQSDGFSTEDSSYIQALGDLRTIEAEIEKNEHILAHAKVLDERVRQKDKGKVQLGSRVKLKAGKHEMEYMIVESLEADPSQGKISDKSPLGRALLGKRIREYITLKPLRRRKPISLELVSIK